ncbi:MAG: secondary thiamine-phosphate synthase enzyme [Candidatus Levybacteria bacterium CG10_big_fil_rev_8_21_14_0_10_36_7]|nr:MAG: secondary thiamine-phosphate synthase enzyme [Candidatus Levybacteria bacterium CG10_big_fil_rev_8_21_14_0_10_36_7]
MNVFNKIISVTTKQEYDCTDITDQVKEMVNESQIKNGLVNVQTMHTTAAIILNENEPLLIEDIKSHLEKLSSKESSYNHDNFEIRTVNMCDGECANGHAHCKAILLPSTATLNLLDGKLQLGQWQRILFWELDRSRSREIQVHIFGE